MEILTTVLLGLLIVFSGLVLICLLIALLHRIIEKAEARKSVPEQSAAFPEQEEMPREVLVAILTAAVAAYTPENQGRFRVVSFRRRDR